MIPSQCPACGFADLPILSTIDLTIDLSGPSLNQIGSNTRGRSGLMYRGAKRKFENKLRRVRFVPCGERKRRVYLIREYKKGKREYDYGNWVGGCKPLLDVLRDRGALYDDSPQWLEDYYTQLPSPDGKDHVRVIIQDIQWIRK